MKKTTLVQLFKKLHDRFDNILIYFLITFIWKPCHLSLYFLYQCGPILLKNLNYFLLKLIIYPAIDCNILHTMKVLIKKYINNNKTQLFHFFQICNSNQPTTKTIHDNTHPSTQKYESKIIFQHNTNPFKYRHLKLNTSNVKYTYII